MNSENSKTSEFHTLLFHLSQNIIFKRSDKYLALPSFSIYSKLKNIKKSYKSNELKIAAPTWNEEFELASYSVSDIRDYFEYIIKDMRQLLIILQ